ncbi:ThuA domain-containing protein [Sanguibacter inulinus]|uniref:ThuA domain-containing protein n=1 Tax=Sanguibacter inulinus TaxID=60922 RepID=A0A853ERF9_9MICO|nr:ThuA domain-containing protein [Sanguibacter inulinus]MBF0722014.1 ThuA domain-containing protein [Sanguibacter inulinus]NYS93159.1 ThuA domain-containing protein [Sanguibacter inulinus]
MTSVPRVLVLAGRGRYEDPWHDMAATSHKVAEVLSAPTIDGTDDLGSPAYQVSVRGAFPDALDDLDPAGDGVDLVVVNTSSGRPDPGFDGDDSRWSGFHERLRAWADAGRPVLGLHQAANTFADSAHWERILGGRWVDGTSMHPDIGEADFTLAGADHDLAGVLRDVTSGTVTAFDERYSYLRVAESSTVLLTQQHDGIDHPVVWVSGAPGVRCVYDALGHGARSYDSPSRQALLRAEVTWLLAGT